MSVFAEANRQAIDAFDEIVAGGLTEPTQPAEPFLAAFASDDDRQALLDEFEHVRELGVETSVELLDHDAMHLRCASRRSVSPARRSATACGSPG